jgi:hypothetical protein
MEIILDTQGFAGRGVSQYSRADGSSLQPGLNLNLARFAVRGVVLDKIRYQLQIDMGTSNSRGPFQSNVFNGGFNDAWIDYRFDRAFSIRIGQLPTPFGFEQMKRGSLLDFAGQSRTSLLANLGRRDLGIMGYGFSGPFAYAAGVFNGEGRAVAPLDSAITSIGRFGVRINETGNARAQVNVSASYGGADPENSISQPSTLGLTTPRGYQFWDSVYQVNVGIPTEVRAPAEVRIVRAGSERQVGLDAMVQIGDFDLATEAVYLDHGRREVGRNVVDSALSLRAGEFTGYSYNVSANMFLTRGDLFRDARFFWSRLEADNIKFPDRDNFSPAIAVRARWEQSFLDYDSIARSPAGTTRGLLDLYSTRIRVDSLQMAIASYFSTRLRMQLEYGMYYFPGNLNTDPNSFNRRLDNQALAPGAVVQGERGTAPPPNLPVNVGYGDPQLFRPHDIAARALHEFTFRVHILIP